MKILATRERQNEEQRLDDFIQNELFVTTRTTTEDEKEATAKNNTNHTVDVEVWKGMSTKKFWKFGINFWHEKNK